MKTLIVYSHPNSKSFNHAIKELIENDLKKYGHEVKVRDLYKTGFDPVLSGNDIVGIQSGTVSEPIRAEQEYIDWAETLIIVHPVWWTGLPAIMKGYIDRVFSFGFAYVMEETGPKGLLNGKKVLIINTTGAPTELYQQMGMHDAIKSTSDIGIYEFCGLTVIDHIFFGAVPTVTDEVRQGYLSDLSEKLKSYFSDK